jgi:hypothetical protein
VRKNEGLPQFPNGYLRQCAFSVLVAGWVGIVSAGGGGRVIAWPVISTGSSSTEGSSTTDAYRHSRAYTPIVATTINANTTSSIISGRVI